MSTISYLIARIPLVLHCYPPVLAATQAKQDIGMERDFSLDTAADGWFPDGIEILPRPSFVAIAAVLATLVVAIATVVRLLRAH